MTGQSSVLDAKSFIQGFRSVAAANPRWVALDRAGMTLTYSDLADRVGRTAGALVSSGVGAVSVVGITIGDEIEHMVATLAALAAGADQVSLASHETEDLYRRLATVAGVTHVLAEGPGTPDVGRPILPWREIAAGAEPLADWVGGRTLLRTSGSTGGIKLIALGDEQLALQCARSGGDHAGRRTMRAASVEHNLGKRHALYALWAGGTVVVQPKPGMPIDLDYCRARGVDVLDIGYVHAVSLLSGTSARAEGLEICLSGTFIPSALRLALRRKFGCAPTVRYGATECGTIALSRDDGDDGVGRPADGVAVEIVDSEGRPAVPGVTGEIRVRAPGMAERYIDAPADTAARFRDGWFWPGDMGHLDADGRLTVSGRTDDMIILGGINVFPGEVEEALLAHPAVRMAAAVGLPSATFGQIPVAAVELREASSATQAELLAFARERLALRAPRGVLIVPSLPRDGVGKIARRQVAALLQTGERTS